MRRTLRVVLDTSTVVSGIIGGISTEVIDLLQEGAFQAIVSEEILQEYAEVLRRPRFGFPSGVVADILNFFATQSLRVTPRTPVSVVTEDPDDNKFLEAAIAGQADSILSGDYHLLRLGTFEGIPIMGPRTVPAMDPERAPKGRNILKGTRRISPGRLPVPAPCSSSSPPTISAARPPSMPPWSWPTARGY
jgi:putative PIN family toxin of toxin-antitoxin system